MSGREIVTLQFGHYANFTGTHWWNLQEASFVYDPKILQLFPKEINHDVLFREGQTLKGDTTFTPRLVALDLNGSLGSLRKDGALYCENNEEEVRWSGDVTLHKAVSESKNEFLRDLDDTESTSEKDSEVSSAEQSHPGENEDEAKAGESPRQAEPAVFGKKFYDLDDDVKVWSDYLGLHLHPRSMQIVKDFILGSKDQPFEVFGLGQQVLSGDSWDEWEDRVRFFTEECDLMQGFQVLFDSHNGFGGAARKGLSYLRDEFPGKSILTVPLTPTVLPDQTVVQRATRILNNALCLGTCCQDSSLYIPMSLASSLWKNVGAARTFPHLSYKSDLPYHTSAILAVSLDTLTLPFRRDAEPAHLSDTTGAFSHSGRKVAALNACVPFSMPEEGTFVDRLVSDGDAHLWQPLTPHTSCTSPPSVQLNVVRGVPPHRVLRKDGSCPQALLSCSSAQEVLQMYLAETYPRTLSAPYAMRDPAMVGSPFPHIFQPNISQDGHLSTLHRQPTAGVDSIPVMTSLQSNASVGDFVSSLKGEVSRFNIRRHHHFLEAGLEEEEFAETLHTLQTLAECYNLQATSF